MAQGLFQMSRVPASNLARDRIVTTFHLDTDPVEGSTDWQTLATDAAALFAGTLGGITGYTGFECRVYRHGGAKNDPPEATAFAATTGTEAPRPHEVALCLSYFADFNAPRRRGRMYIGPWGNLNERPSEGQQITLRTLANGISALGGVNVPVGAVLPDHGRVPQRHQLVRRQRVGHATAPWPAGDEPADGHGQRLERPARRRRLYSAAATGAGAPGQEVPLPSPPSLANLEVTRWHRTAAGRSPANAAA